MKAYIGISLVILVAAMAMVLIMRQCEESTRKQLGAIKNSIAEVFKVQPEVRINQRIIYAQTTPIAELAIVTKEQLIEYTWTEKRQIFGQNIPQTGKKITSKAVYRLKAGFDLTQPFVVKLDSASGKITATLPPAKILSVETVNSPELSEEAGLLTSITPEHRQEALRGLDEAAHKAAQTSGLVNDAQQQAQTRLEEIFKRNGQTVQIELKQTL